MLLLLNVTGVFRSIVGLDTAILVTLLAGYKTFYNSISALLEKTISADLALCIAVIAALSVGEYLAAAEAMFIVMVGETLESFAAGRTEAAIQRFVAQLPRTARLLTDGREEVVDAAALLPGDRIVVRAGERIAADGMIEQGASSIDESSITGEPLPQYKRTGDEVFSGTLNGNGAAAHSRDPRRRRDHAGPRGGTGEGGQSEDARRWSAWPIATRSTFCRRCCWRARSPAISRATGCARWRC